MCRYVILGVKGLVERFVLLHTLACTVEEITEAPAVTNVIRFSPTFASIRIQLSPLDQIELEYFEVNVYNSSTGIQNTDLMVLSLA